MACVATQGWRHVAVFFAAPTGRGAAEALLAGPLGVYPLTALPVTLVDGKMQSVQSSEGAIFHADAAAARRRCADWRSQGGGDASRAVLLEPTMRLAVIVDEAHATLEVNLQGLATRRDHLSGFRVAEGDLLVGGGGGGRVLLLAAALPPGHQRAHSGTATNTMAVSRHELVTSSAAAAVLAARCGGGGGGGGRPGGERGRGREGCSARADALVAIAGLPSRVYGPVQAGVATSRSHESCFFFLLFLFWLARFSARPLPARPFSSSLHAALPVPCPVDGAPLHTHASTPAPLQRRPMRRRPPWWNRRARGGSHARPRVSYEDTHSTICFPLPPRLAR